MGRERITITKGAGWRKFVREMPHRQMRAIGTVKVGDLEGALVRDTSEGCYWLLTGSDRYRLDEDQVRAALDIQ